MIIEQNEKMFYNIKEGGFMKEKIVFHVDVNNAFLSWTATYLLLNGFKQDIRKIPSIIGGDEKERKGIVLAKSPIAKKYALIFKFILLIMNGIIKNH